MPNKDQLSPDLRLQVNKRLTLNLLIQGAATHAFLSAHHLAADEFNELDSSFVDHYDQMMVALHLGYWVGALPLLMGNPVRYFRKLERFENPFQFHPFMLKHGRSIAEESRAFIFGKAAEHELSTSGLKNEKFSMKMCLATLELEQPHKFRLEEMARSVCSQVYGIDPALLDAELTRSPEFGIVRTPTTWAGRLVKKCMIGWSGVERHDGKLKVIAKAWIWPLLTHELVKGTVELICLHGLSQLEDEVFESVMDETEHVEYEIPMLQIGGTFFRKFLAVVPRSQPLAEAIMLVSRMEPSELDHFLSDMIESPNRATDRLAKHGRDLSAD